MQLRKNAGITRRELFQAASAVIAGAALSPAAENPAMNYPVKAQPQLTLPATWYHTPEIFERERRRVFAREWQFIGPVSHLQNPGDYLAVEQRPGGGSLRIVSRNEHRRGSIRVGIVPREVGVI